MTSSEKPEITPHHHRVNLTQFKGICVLGEQLDLLLSGFLRLQFGAVHNGLMEVTATFPNEEAHAIERAMKRVERKIPGDRRTKAQRDCDRFTAVFGRAFETVEAVRGRRAAEAG